MGVNRLSVALYDATGAQVLDASRGATQRTSKRKSQFTGSEARGLGGHFFSVHRCTHLK